jgi:DNA-binding NarL/FixJ family response regulator
MADAAVEAASTRVLIVDDHELAREALVSILGREPDLEVVGEASDGETAVALAGRLRPDLVLMDVRMPGLDGLAATQRIKRELPETRILVLTTYDTQESVLAGLRAGADGYVLKGASKQELLGAIRAILRGEQSVQPALAASILRRVAHGEGQAVAAQPPLTDRQRAVLLLVAAGRSNPEIAQELHVSLNTVKTHVVHVLRRLGVTDRTQAAVRAAQLGLLDEEPSSGGARC